MPGYSCAYYLRVSGLILGIMIGVGKKQEKHTPHNLLITLIGGILVWLGWYGFNVGSAFTFDQIAMVSFVNTVIAASAGALGWLILEYALKNDKSFRIIIRRFIRSRCYYSSSRLC